MAEQSKINLEIYKLFVQTITEANNIELMANKLTQILVATLGIKGATIFILDPELEELEFLGSAGLSTSYIHKGPILVDKSIKLGANREPVVISDTQKSDQLQYPEKAVAEGIRAIVSHPITMRGKIIGALRLYHSAQWEIAETDMSYLEVLAQNIGVALMYFRVANAIHNVRETVDEIHPVWL